MPNFRDIKRNMRRNVHQHLRVPALYIAPNGTATPLNVRDFTKFGATSIEGAVRSGNGQMVERQEMFPMVLFMLDELEEFQVTLLRSGVISFQRGEAYSLDNAEAPDDITVKWNVTRITDTARLSTLPIPEDLV